MSRKNPHESYPATFFGGILFGALVGSLLAFWYAPQSGEETLATFKGWLGMRNESIEAALEEGRAFAHQHRARFAHRLTDKNT